MIPDRWHKLIAVLQTICQHLQDARPYDDRMLARYLHVLDLRASASSVIDFVDRPENLGSVFDLLSVWNQNTERSTIQEYQLFSSTVEGNASLGKELLETFDHVAQNSKLEGLALFCSGIRQCRQGLMAIEGAAEHSPSALCKAAGAVYDSLPYAQSRKYVVSNAVLLHLLFPRQLMPIDGQHTVAYLYGREGMLTAARYVEAIAFQQEVLSTAIEWERYLDDGWNTTAPKLVDNAIIYLARLAKLEDRLGVS